MKFQEAALAAREAPQFQGGHAFIQLTGNNSNCICIPNTANTPLKRITLSADGKKYGAPHNFQIYTADLLNDSWEVLEQDPSR